MTNHADNDKLCQGHIAQWHFGGPNLVSTLFDKKGGSTLVIITVEKRV